MKIETKYNIEDTLWRVFKNIPTEFTITKVFVTVSKNKIEINYSLLEHLYGCSYTHSEQSLDCDFANTKKELLCKMFDDCIEDGKVLK